MLAPSDISTLILKAQAFQAQLTRVNASEEYRGNLNVNWRKISQLSLLIQSMTYCLNVQDYTSSNSFAVYGSLKQCVGSRFTNGIAIDPTAQPPGNIIVITNTSAFGFVKSDPIAFSGVGQFTVTLANWPVNYAPEWGLNPSIEIFTNQAGVDQKDTQTQPIYNYLIAGDQTTPLQSISFTYYVTTAGFYTIAGVIPTTGTSGGGGTGSGGGSYFIIYAGDPKITYDGGNNLVYTNASKLNGKSGYYISVSQNNSVLFDGIGFNSNPVTGSFTMIGNPGFVIDPNFPLIVNLN